MKMKKLHDITGWIMFLFALIVYTLTLEPTASLWDCSEFIASVYKLQITHPPGASLFLLVGRFFAIFAGGNVLHVAFMVNLMSAVSSALTILFLYWSSVMLMELTLKKIRDNSQLTKQDNIILVIAGIVASVSFTFSDSFWFSAVEAEVYALSSFLTAVSFWAGLKWIKQADPKKDIRWMLLVVLIAGLSFGVHILNLLVIPAVVLIFYFNQYQVTTKGVIYASIIAFAILVFSIYSVPFLLGISTKFELIFVNSFRLPKHSGLIFFWALLFGLLAYGVYYAQKSQKSILKLVFFSVIIYFIGCSTLALVLIRSASNPPLDSNNPEDAFNLLFYLNREQYPQQPLFFGPYFNAPVEDNIEGKPYYRYFEGKYVECDNKIEYKYDDSYTTFFPRMYSREQRHIDGYKYWAGLNMSDPKKKPSFGKNLLFFFRYQIGHMYLRYFMWNFVGRQNDLQGHGDNLQGNWISGISAIDNARLGDQTNIPDEYKNNKARNRYFFLPLILGILGLAFHFKHDQLNAWAVLIFFLLTGAAIVVYLNQKPFEPRERDYSFAGSFYAFSIWLGFGVLSVYEYLHTKLKTSKQPAIILSSILLFVPALMGFQNWDDHDRSGRYTVPAYAYNYLNSCAPNAILFTNADNDTFPLWYAQEVEGVRPDVRIVCLPYLTADWYVTQMKQKCYDSEPLPISFTRAQYLKGRRDFVYVFDKKKERVDIKTALGFIKSDDLRTKLQNNPKLDYLPAKKLKLEVDKDQVLRTGTVSEKDKDKIVDEIIFDVPQKYLIKNQLMILDIIANNNWERPIYFTSVTQENVMGMDDYFQLEGFAYRLVPIKTPSEQGGNGRIDTDLLYDKVMNIFRWGTINDESVHLDNYHLNTFHILRVRSLYSRLAQALLDKGEKDKALQVLDKCIELFPHSRIEYDYEMVGIIETYIQAGAPEKAKEIIDILSEVNTKNLAYYETLGDNSKNAYKREIQIAMYTLQQMQYFETQLK